MKNQLMSITHKNLFVLMLLLFTVPNLLFAQQHNYMYSRLNEIDSEMIRLSHLNRAIEKEFKKISDFSVQARPLLINYKNYKELIEQTKEERNQLMLNGILLNKTAIDTKTAKIRELTKYRDEYELSYRKSGGLVSPNKVQCNTFNELLEAYQETTDYYLEQKTKYDAINKQLAQLNTEKHDLETKLKYMGDQSIGALDPTGCWRLSFGNHISEITIKKELGKYIGRLTVNNLQDYEDGQIVLILDRTSDNTFRGVEYTWKEKPNGLLTEYKIPAMITLNNNNQFITWTSDQTVTMERCY